MSAFLPSIAPVVSERHLVTHGASDDRRWERRLPQFFLLSSHGPPAGVRRRAHATSANLTSSRHEDAPVRQSASRPPLVSSAMGGCSARAPYSSTGTLSSSRIVEVPWSVLSGRTAAYAGERHHARAVSTLSNSSTTP